MQYGGSRHATVFFAGQGVSFQVGGGSWLFWTCSTSGASIGASIGNGGFLLAVAVVAFAQVLAMVSRRRAAAEADV